MDKNAVNEIKRGEIYWAEPNTYKYKNNDHTYDGFPTSRPAVIVSNNKNNVFSDAVEVIYLTSKHKTDLPTHTAITNPGLWHKSTAMCEQITSIPKARLGDKIGECTPEQMQAIDACLAISLGIDNIIDKMERGKEQAEAQAKVAEQEKTIKQLRKELDRLKNIEELYILTVEYVHYGQETDK